MSTPLRLAVLAAISAGCGAAAAEGSTVAYWVRAMPGAWSASADGHIAYAEEGLPATSRDLDELGVANREIAPMIEVGVRLPLLFDINAGLHHFATEGSATLTEAFTFGDQVFIIGDRVDSDVDLLDAYAELMFRIPIPGDLVSVSAGLGAHLVQAEWELVSQNTSQRQTLDEDLPIPFIAARVQVAPLPMLGAEVGVQWMRLDLGEVEAGFIDVRAQVTYRPWTLVGISAGYRHIAYDIEVDRDEEQGELDLTLTGPYASLLVQF